MLQGSGSLTLQRESRKYKVREMTQQLIIDIKPTQQSGSNEDIRTNLELRNMIQQSGSIDDSRTILQLRNMITSQSQWQGSRDVSLFSVPLYKLTKSGGGDIDRHRNF